MKLGNWVNCYVFGLHTWTSKSLENIEPDINRIKNEDIMIYFKEYSTMYCKYCGKISRLSK